MFNYGNNTDDDNINYNNNNNANINNNNERWVGSNMLEVLPIVFIFPQESKTEFIFISCFVQGIEELQHSVKHMFVFQKEH